MGYTPNDPDTTSVPLTTERDIDVFRLVRVDLYLVAKNEAQQKAKVFWEEGFMYDGEFHAVNEKHAELKGKDYDDLMEAVTATGAFGVELDTAVWTALQSANEIPVGTIT
jgi:hypothetical protein